MGDNPQNKGRNDDLEYKWTERVKQIKADQDNEEGQAASIRYQLPLISSTSSDFRTPSVRTLCEVHAVMNQKMREVIGGSEGRRRGKTGQDETRKLWRLAGLRNTRSFLFNQILTPLTGGVEIYMSPAITCF
ncbi:hypothetical protein KEM54_002667 [Ascosphaera aggregata]|nr:hypothetical protein KEM54_002667 [Ascosphaera aggregata]